MPAVRLISAPMCPVQGILRGRGKRCGGHGVEVAKRREARSGAQAPRSTAFGYDPFFLALFTQELKNVVVAGPLGDVGVWFSESAERGAVWEQAYRRWQALSNPADRRRPIRVQGTNRERVHTGAIILPIQIKQHEN